ncbi:MAG: M23 family metallopeptidase, partial [Treponema sp.]|nr:M23 family metallopeptidase [Treponema sp.]
FLLFAPGSAGGEGTQAPGEQSRPDEASRPRFALIPENPRPGEPVTLGFFPAGGEPKTASLLDGRGRRLSRSSFFAAPIDYQGRPLMAAVLTVPSTARPGLAVIRIEGSPETTAEIPLTIAGRDFVSEEIELNQTLTDIRAAPDPQKTAESEQLWAILSRTGADIYCSGVFIPPVASTRRTSFFGDRRVFIYAGGARDTSIHGGVDYGVPRGTPVSACGPGKVILARNRIVTGNSVVLEHLPGVYSLYYHLDSIAVAEGTVVNAGDTLGLSGATGLATGPHLHWEIRVSGENTDPDAFISRPILDKDAILSKMGYVVSD